MRTSRTARNILAGLSISLTLAACHARAQPSESTKSKQTAPASWTAVDQALGRPGTTQPDGVRRYSFPRTDLNVQLDGVRLKPALALGSWLAFRSGRNNDEVMGDLVLTPEEVNPVMSGLLNGGIEVTAVHNHLLRASPPTIYMHVRGQGDPAKLAATLRAAALDLDAAGLDGAIGRKGKVNGGVYQFTIPRGEKITNNGMDEGASMGTGTAINFQPLGGGRAATTGDFVLLASEVDPVMRALRSSGIEITALHSHMLGEQPSLYFMHFWAVGDASKLAAGLRSGLDRMNLQH